MHNVVDRTLDAAAEAVVLTFVVVVTHIYFVLEGLVCLDDFSFDGDFGVSDWSATLVFDVVGWVDPAAVFALGDV